MATIYIFTWNDVEALQRPLLDVSRPRTRRPLLAEIVQAVLPIGVSVQVGTQSIDPHVGVTANESGRFPPPNSRLSSDPFDELANHFEIARCKGFVLAPKMASFRKFDFFLQRSPKSAAGDEKSAVLEEIHRVRPILPDPKEYPYDAGPHRP